MPYYEDDLRDGFSLFWFILCGGVALLIVIGLGTLAWQKSLPWQHDNERQSIQSDRGYIQTQQTELISQTQEIRKLEADIKAYGDDPQKADAKSGAQAQIKAGLDTIEQKMAQLNNPDDVPQQTRTLLAEYNR